MPGNHDWSETAPIHALRRPEDEGCDDDDRERAEPSDERSSKCRDDQQRDLQRRDRGLDRGQEQPEGSCEHRRCHPVHGGETVRVVAEDQRAAFVLRGCSSGDAEPREPENRPEDRSDADHDEHQDRLVPRDDDASDRPRRVREDGREAVPRGLREADLDDRVQDEVEADRRGDLGKRRRLAQRPEDEQMEEHAHHRTDHHRAEEGPPDPHRRWRGTERDWWRGLDEGDGAEGRREEERPVLPEVVEDEGGVHRHRGDREVDDAGPLVGEGRRQCDGGDQRPGVDPEDGGLQLVMVGQQDHEPCDDKQAPDNRGGLLGHEPEPPHGGSAHLCADIR